MDVVYVLPQGTGGIAHYTGELANAVAESADVTVLKPRDSSADDLFGREVSVIDAFDPIDVTNAGIQRGELNLVDNLKAAVSYANVSRIREIDPDVVHFTAPASMLPQTRLFTWLYRIDRSYSVIETFHNVYPLRLLRRGIDLDDNEPLTNVFVTNLLQAFEVLLPGLRRSHSIVHTESSRDRLVRRGANRGDVSVIPHGTFEFFKDYDHSDVETEPDCLLFFGNLVPTKAPDVAVKAVPLVAERRPDVTMIIAGKGTLSEECRSIIRENESLFEFHEGYVPEESVGRFFRRSELVVIPHRRQYGHSGTLTVAYAYGKPVVTSDVGDFPYLVEEPDCGYTVPKNNSRALADAIVELLEDNNRRSEMQANASKMAQQFSWERIGERHLDVYRTVTNETD